MADEILLRVRGLASTAQHGPPMPRHSPEEREIPTRAFRISGLGGLFPALIGDSTVHTQEQTKTDGWIGELSLLVGQEQERTFVACGGRTDGEVMGCMRAEEERLLREQRAQASRRCRHGCAHETRACRLFAGRSHAPLINITPGPPIINLARSGQRVVGMSRRLPVRSGHPKGEEC